MASFHATLHLAGEQFTLLGCRCRFMQPTDSLGNVLSDVQSSSITMEIVGQQYDTLTNWAFSSHQKLDGEIHFYRTDRETSHTCVTFTEGQCVDYQEMFLPGEENSGSYTIQLGISCAKIKIGTVEHDNQWVVPSS